MNDWQPVRLFVSSTFDDMHAERDSFAKSVVPELFDWCEQRRLLLIDIDLRWGITEEEATLGQRVVGTCLRAARDCDLFVCFLGQRYGWVPEARQFGPELCTEFPELEPAFGRACSLTELEIRGCLSGPRSVAKVGRRPRPVFYLRSKDCLRQLPEHGPLLRIFDDACETDLVLREQLRARGAALQELIREHGHRSYSAAWLAGSSTPELALPFECAALSPEKRASWRRRWSSALGRVVEGTRLPEALLPAARRFNDELTQGRLGHFRCGDHSLAEALLIDLKRALEAQFPENARPESKARASLEVDREQQAQVISNPGYGFVGRRQELSRLNEYLESPQTAPLVVMGPSGIGKSALLAELVRKRTSTPGEAPKLPIVSRLVGRSELSGAVEPLLRSIMAELVERGLIPQATFNDPLRARDAWRKLVFEAGTPDTTAIIIDGIDHLEDGTVDTSFIPYAGAAKGIKLIVAVGDAAAVPDFVEATRFDSAAGFGELMLPSARLQPQVPLSKPELIELRQLAEPEARQLMRLQLAQHVKALDDESTQRLACAADAGSPLFITTVLSELRTFGTYSLLSQSLAAYGDTLSTAFDQAIERLESEPIAPNTSLAVHRRLVRNLLGGLARARVGLSTDELERLVGKGEPESVAAQVASILPRLRSQLRRRAGRYTFVHESFRERCRRRYPTVDPGSQDATPDASWHQRLAAAFGVGAPDRPAPAERFHHLIRGGAAEAVVRLFISTGYLTAILSEHDFPWLLDRLSIDAQLARRDGVPGQEALMALLGALRRLQQGTRDWSDRSEMLEQALKNELIRRGAIAGEAAPGDSAPGLVRPSLLALTSYAKASRAAPVGRVKEVAHDDSGEYVVTAGQSLTLWRISDQTPHPLAAAAAGDYTSVAFLTSRMLVTAQGDQVEVWNVTSGHRVGSFTSPAGAVRRLVAQPRARAFLVMGDQGAVCHHMFYPFQPLFRTTWQNAPVDRLATAVDGLRMFVPERTRVQVLGLDSGLTDVLGVTFPDAISAIQHVPGGVELLVVGSDQGDITLCDLRAARVLNRKRLTGHRPPSYLARDGIFASPRGGRGIVMRAEHGWQPTVDGGDTALVVRLACDQAGELLAVATADGFLRFFALPSLESLGEVDLDFGRSCALTFVGPERCWVVNGDGAIWLVQVDRRSNRPSVEPITGPADIETRFLQDGRVVARRQYGHEVELIVDAEVLPSEPQGPARPFSVVKTPGGSGSPEPRMNLDLFPSPNRERLCCFPMLRLNQTETMFLSINRATFCGVGYLWRGLPKARPFPVELPSSDLHAGTNRTAFSPHGDGAIVIATSGLQVVPLTGAAPVSWPDRPRAPADAKLAVQVMASPIAVAIAPDGRKAAAVWDDDSRTLHVFQIDAGEPLAPVEVRLPWPVAVVHWAANRDIALFASDGSYCVLHDGAQLCAGASPAVRPELVTTSVDGQWLCVATGDPARIFLFARRDMTLRGVDVCEGPLSDLLLSQDGRFLFVADHRGALSTYSLGLHRSDASRLGPGLGRVLLIGRDLDLQANRLRRSRSEPVAELVVPSPHSGADPDREAAISIERSRGLQAWNALPFWKRLITKRPRP